MRNAIKQVVTVQEEGTIFLQSRELKAGQRVEVIIIPEEERHIAPDEKRAMHSFQGARKEILRTE
ncbi:MAG TPA: hypothetical protein PLO37_07000 [Candidatus Hydrogenedentes bacterium]|nr:hypothetical protein [Candidatus Hydrogenedentota bacterium]HPG66579.1 hypothetical protein [Candidatus Hydrogenedentota bacterium]